MAGTNVIPSFYGTALVGAAAPYDGEAFGNGLLRFGEVKRIIKPTDDDSRTKKFYEYDILVQHRENDTADGRTYYSCLNVNDLCGLADKVEFTLRIDDTGTNTEDPQLTKGFGSKVLILCLNGSQNEAVILGGLRDDTDSDKEDEGHHYTWQFNGSVIKVEDDGSYSIQVNGATKADGSPGDNRPDGGGSSIRVSANGDIIVSTKDSKQAITISNQDGTIAIAADQDCTINGTQIHVGKNATEPGVLGNQLLSLLTQTLALIGKMSGGLTNPQLAGDSAAEALALIDTIPLVLSKTVTIKE